MRLLLAAPIVYMVALAAERAARGSWGAAVAFTLPCFVLVWLAARSRR